MFPLPAPAAEQAAGLVGGINDVARGVGSLLHAKQCEQQDADHRAKNGKNMHGSPIQMNS
jgi:hypothetical protein